MATRADSRDGRSGRYGYGSRKACLLLLRVTLHTALRPSVRASETRATNHPPTVPPHTVLRCSTMGATTQRNPRGRRRRRRHPHHYHIRRLRLVSDSSKRTCSSLHHRHELRPSLASRVVLTLSCANPPSFLPRNPGEPFLLPRPLPAAFVPTLSLLLRQALRINHARHFSPESL